MDESLKDLPKLFVDKMIKVWIFEYVKVVPQLPKLEKWNKQSEEMESMSISIYTGKKIWVMLILQKYAMWSSVLLIWNKHLEKKISLLLSHQVQEPLNSEK